MSHVRVVLATRKSLVEDRGRDIRNRQSATFKDETCLFYIRTQCVPRTKHRPLLGYFSCLDPNTRHLGYQNQSLNVV